ncbi:MAG: hypothetical protein H7125_08470 [Proteobacteria bacterium]|nr:hypothetical protein [Burkholderiales bacterium]
MNLEHLFDGLGTGDLRFAASCTERSGAWVTLDGYVARTHDDRGWVLVDQPGACPDCSPVPVAAVQLPGFAPAVTPDPAVSSTLHGRLSFGFRIGADGTASFLRLDHATLA